MRRATKWLAFLMVMAMLLTFLLAGTLTASAQETTPPPEDDGVITLEEAPRVTPPDLVEQGRSEELVEPEPVGSVGSFEALVWDDTANPDGALNEGEIYVDGLTVNLYIKRPDGTWKPYGSKVTGPEPTNFVRSVPWINPLHVHGWVGWDGLPLSYTGVEVLPAGDSGGTNSYAYADYKMELVPSGKWLPSNKTVRYGRLYAIQLFPFQWAPALWYYPQNGDPAARGFGLWEPSMISGYAFHDSNADGKKSSRESCLKGWTIILTVDLKEVARTTTDANGYYEFKGLAPGFYQVWEAEKSWWKLIFYYHPPIVPRPSGVYRGNHFVWIKPHENYADRNFGNLRMDSICDMYYYGKYVIALVKYWLGLGVKNPNAYL